MIRKVWFYLQEHHLPHFHPQTHCPSHLHFFLTAWKIPLGICPNSEKEVMELLWDQTSNLGMGAGNLSDSQTYNKVQKFPSSKNKGSPWKLVVKFNIYRHRIPLIFFGRCLNWSNISTQLNLPRHNKSKETGWCGAKRNQGCDGLLSRRHMLHIGTREILRNLSEGSGKDHCSLWLDTLCRCCYSISRAPR